MVNPVAPAFSLIQLRSFIAITEELSFRKAAQKLQMAPSSLTSQMKVLEDSLGTSLFTRSRRAVHLTRAGTLLLDAARDLLTEAEHVVQVANAAGSNKRSNRIVIGIGRELADTVNQVTQQFMQHSVRKVDLVYREVVSSAQCKGLQDRTLDVGFLRTPTRPHQVNSQLLYSQPLVVILSRTHPLAGADSVKIEQLANEPVLVRSRESAPAEHDQILEIFRNKNLQPRMIETTLSPQFIGDMRVATGQGIYIVPERVVKTHKNLTSVKLDDPLASRSIYVAWRRGERLQHILNFIETTRRVFSTNAAPLAL